MEQDPMDRDRKAAGEPARAHVTIRETSRGAEAVAGAVAD
ncbi:hypothetical protein MSL71_46910 [Desulfoluna butyratoxydans]|uniref:Uncharacterized protein n=1 Tax=Desulfoluna butyratoxydans TaxID=231438 RepID=A0A4U8YUC4_9BACT|nr:hypothetical protein MSL71_46910 [Desulfoluna butyratoxydans]